jgi:hypothetical protein
VSSVVSILPIALASHQSLACHSLTMQQLDLTQVLEEVLTGKQRIISHAGTGQYQATSESASVGTSACGLAALNCARVVFQYQDSRDSNKPCHCGQSEHEMHDEGRCLLYRTLSHRAAEVSVF